MGKSSKYTEKRSRSKGHDSRKVSVAGGGRKTDSNQEREQMAKEATAEAVKKSMFLLSQSMRASGKSKEFANAIIQEVELMLTSATGVSAGADVDGDGGSTATSAESSSSTPSSTKRPAKRDNHNETCEVCDNGGDLLCCDTCTLVFHLACIRPKLASVPKGKWSCSYCITEGSATGDLDAAKRGIRNMKDLRRSKDLPCDDGDERQRPITGGDMSIVRMGRQFVTRKLIHGQIIELDRHANLDKALFEIKDAMDKSMLSLARKVGDIGEVGRGPATPHGTEVMHADGELWCIYCMDDASIPICAFCGCKTCFGKHESEHLLLCDGCDNEWHTYCLHPPLHTIPEGHWFCQSCVASGKDQEVLAEEEADRLAEEEAAMMQAAEEEREREREREQFMMAMAQTALEREEAPVVRRPGRPKGSVGKKRAEMLQTVYGGDLTSMQAAMRARKKVSLAQHVAANAVAGRKRKRHGVSVDWDRADPEMGGCYSRSEIHAPQGPEGLQRALAVVKKAGRRVLQASELAALERFKAWAPIEDLQKVIEAFKDQRQALLRVLDGDGVEGGIPISDSTDFLSGTNGNNIDPIDTFEGLEDEHLLTDDYLDDNLLGAGEDDLLMNF